MVLNQELIIYDEIRNAGWKTATSKKKKKEARRGEANLRSGILFPEERERERESARESAVWKREKKERVHFSRLTKAA